MIAFFHLQQPFYYELIYNVWQEDNIITKKGMIKVTFVTFFKSFHLNVKQK